MFNLVEAHFSSEANYLVQLSMSLQKQVKNLVRFQNQQLSQLSHQIQTESPKVIRKANFKLKHIQSGIKRQPMFAIQVAQQHIAHQQQLLQIWSRKTLAEENQLLTYQSQRVKYLSPKSVLSRGYSLILKKGKIVTDISKLKKGDEIQNISSHGKVNSIIKNIETNAEDEIQ
jgi:exodeoxyribonuclease VII large subunit